MTGLAIPAPFQAMAGQTLTAALWNANVYNGLTFLLNPPVFSGYQATAQSLANTAWTALGIDTTLLDSYGGHSNTVNNSRYTAQIPGWYTVNGCYSAGNNSAGFRAIRLQVNGTPVPGSALYGPPTASAERMLVTPTRDIYLNTGDYVEVAGWQSTGGALSTFVGGTEARSALWVRFSHV